MSIKKSFTAFVLLIFSISLFAQQKSDLEEPQKGFYLGTEGGISLINLKGTYYSVAPFPEGSQSINRKYTKYVQHLFGGYGLYKSRLYLGTEIDLSFYVGEIKDRFDFPDYGFEVTNNFKFAINGLIGSKIGQNSLIYGQLGLVYTDINVAANLQPFDPEASGSVHDWTGVLLGGGYSRAINNHLSFRVKYNLTTYFDGPKYDNDKGDGEKTDYKFIDQRFSIGIVYTF